jgi:hypothetical protein
LWGIQSQTHWSSSLQKEQTTRWSFLKGRHFQQVYGMVREQTKWSVDIQAASRAWPGQNTHYRCEEVQRETGSQFKA